MAEVDSLEIKIAANATKANSALEELTGKLDILSGSLTKINGSGLQGLANATQKLGNAMQSFKGVGPKKFEMIANGINKLNNIDTAGLNKAASAIGQINKSLSGMSALSSSSKQIAELAQGISKLGYKSATQAITNIPALAKAMRQLMTELSKAPKVSQNLIDMTNALGRLARTGASSGRAAKSLSSSLNLFSSSAGNASKKSWSLAASFGKFYATWWLIIRAAGKLKDAINLSSDLTEVQNVVDVTFGQYADKLEDLSKVSITNFGMSELTTKQIASRFQAMGTAMGIAQGQMADMSIELTKLSADMASFYNVDQEDVARSLWAVFTGEEEPLRKYGLDLTQATLQEWALNNGLKANMRTMTQAEKTLLRYQYVMANTTAAQGDFLRTADTWANRMRVLRQQFQAFGTIVGEVFINAFKPVLRVLNDVMNHVIDFARTVADALGAIFGWTIEISDGGATNEVADSTGDIADNMGEAAAAAKKFKDVTLGIDELNIISKDSGDSGSGGGGTSGGSTGAGQNTNIVKTDSILGKYESEIKKLEQLGEYIGDSLTKALNSIDWDSVYESAKDFGKGLADFLNGLISPDLFGAVGKTIAASLNTAIYTALSFGANFEFDEFGESIAESINKFFEEFDFEALAETLNVWVDGLEETIESFLKTMDWGKILSGIGEFLTSLSPDAIAAIIGITTIKKFGSNIVEAIKNNIGTKGTLKIAGVSLVFSGFLTTISGTGDLSTVGMSALETFVGTYLLTGNVKTATIALTVAVGLNVAVKFSNWFAEKLATSIFESNGIENPELEPISLTQAIDFFIDWNFGEQSDEEKGAKESAEKKLRDMISKWADDKGVGFLAPLMNFGIGGGWKDLLGDIQLGAQAQTDNNQAEVEAMGNFTEGLKSKWEEFANWWNSNGVSSWWNDSVIPFFSFEHWTEVGTNIKTGLQGAWDSFNSWWENTGIPGWWNENVSPWFTLEQWSELGSNIKGGIKDKWEDLNTWWKDTGIPDWWDNNVAPWFTKKQWSDLGENVKSGLEEKWKSFNSWWEGTGIPDWWDNNVSPWFTKKKWKETTEGIKAGLKDTWNNARTWWDNNKTLSEIKAKLPDLLAKIREIWNNVKTWWDDNVRLEIPELNFHVEFESKGLNSIQKAIVDVLNLPGWPSFKFFQDGGFPNTADIFFANENGVPELIGTMGGRTAVASGTEITGISDAIYNSSQAEVILLRQQNELLTRILEKDMSVNISDRAIARANIRGKKSMGMQIIHV